MAAFPAQKSSCCLKSCRKKGSTTGVCRYKIICLELRKSSEALGTNDSMPYELARITEELDKKS